MLPVKHGKDRRIQKTQDSLRKALASLIGEKDYSAIVIKEILARANVGRSAFYAHFRDKDDLLSDCIYDMLREAQTRHQLTTARPEERLIWFSQPIFEFHYQHRHYETTPGDKKQMEVAMAHVHLGKVLIKLIEKDVNREYQKRPSLSSRMPPGLLVEHIISSFILVLNWWVENNMAQTPAEIELVYRKLIQTCLKAVLD